MNWNSPHVPGGWEGLKLKRQEGIYLRSDKRMLGDNDFVTKVLAQSKEQIKKSHALHAAGMDLDKVAERVSQIMGLKPKEIWAAGKQRHIVNARSLFYYWSVRELGVSMSSLADRFGISVPAVNK